MAKQVTVYLGYEDEGIEGRLSKANYTVDKIGGLPDWPPLENLKFCTKCPLCNLHRLLVVQCCAPIQNSLYIRTLYVFACINPNCWNQSESWTCVRSQIEDKDPIVAPATEVMPSVETNLSWCQGSDEWDDNDNGNSFMNIDNSPSSNNVPQRNSDDEDESNSFDLEAMEQALGKLQVFDATNANNFPIQGAVGVPVAVAEIEGKDDCDLVTVDTPTVPTRNIESLFQQTAELPPDIRSRLTCGQLQFVPKYIYLEKESKKQCNNDDKVIELLNKYRRENDMDISNNVGAPGVGGARAAGGGGGGGGGEAMAGGEDEVYEDAPPLHGDRLFHAFVTRLQRNPEQILRYSRDAPPLLGAPITGANNVPANCTRCGSKLVCEMQLLPRYAEALTLVSDRDKVSLPYLHFLSVLIFTCSESCWLASDRLFKETVVFQPEI